MINLDHYVQKGHALTLFKGSLSANEQKLFACVVAQIRKEDEDYRTYEIPVKEFAEAAEVKGNRTYEMIRETVRGLRRKEILVEREEDGKKGFVVTGFISSGTMKEGDGTAYITLDPKLKPFLLQLKKYTQYQLKYIMGMKSAYSIRIYEICKKWPKNSKTNQIIPLKDFREYIGATEKSYDKMSIFTKRILEVAKKEINELSDINLTIEKIKKGRNITHIKLIYEPSDIDAATEKEFLDTAFRGQVEYIRSELGVGDHLSKKQVIELYEAAIEKTAGDDPVDYFKHYYAEVGQKEGVHDLYSYLLAALKADWNRYLLARKLK